MCISETFKLSPSKVNMSSRQGVEQHDSCALLFNKLAIQRNPVKGLELLDCAHWERSHKALRLSMEQAQGYLALGIAGCLKLVCELLCDWEQLHPEGLTGSRWKCFFVQRGNS